MDYAELRTKMVNNQVRTRDVTDHGILRAMLEIPRERFVPGHCKPFAYADRDLPVSEGGRHLLPPATLARMIQALELKPDGLVLDVACGMGYGAALLAQTTGSVVALEDDAALVSAAEEILSDLSCDNVAVVQGPLDQAYPPEAPYDHILIEGAIELVPPAYVGQLRDGGVIVAVEGVGQAGRATLFTKAGGHLSSRFLFNAAAPLLEGFRKPSQFTF